MFCPTCGAESSPGLRFCKQCGMSLSQTAEMPPPPAKFPTALTITFLLIIGIISIVAIVGPFAMASDMSMRGTPARDFLPVMILGPLVGIGIDALLVWLLLRLVKIYHDPASGTRVSAKPSLAAREFTPPQLSAPPSSVGSVTEHTTRNFDEHEKKIRARQASRDTNEV